MLEQIYLIIIAAAPALTSIIGIIATFVKMKKNNSVNAEALMEKFELVEKEVRSAKEYEALKAELLDTRRQHHELMVAHKELLTKIDRIVRK